MKFGIYVSVVPVNVCCVYDSVNFL
jgi:hypothetical protein